MKKILITGANGFLGTELSNALRASGHQVKGVYRKSPQTQGYIISEFGKSLNLKEEFDYVIHAACSTKAGDESNNIEGTKIWAEECFRNGIKKQLFISSISSKKNSHSAYARSKHELEIWFAEKQVTICRPALIIGNGGIFKKMILSLRKFLIIPVIGGRKRVYFTGVNQIINFVKKDIDYGLTPRVYNLHQPNPVSMAVLLKSIAHSLNLKRIFILIPIAFVEMIYYAIGPIIRTLSGFTRDNILGLKQNDFFNEVSDLEFLGIDVMNINEAIIRNIQDRDTNE